MRAPRPLFSLIVLITVGAITAGCSGATPPATAETAPATAPVVALPPEGAGFDYQLGGAYDPPSGVEIVGRDRTAESDPDLYSICYLNGFQTQPGEQDSWPDDALLRDADGQIVMDPDWPDEALLDISSTAGRAIVVERVSSWIRECADDGFNAVEFDNLDTFTRSDGALTLEDALAVAAPLVDAAHDVGLAAGQKNAAEHSAALHDAADFDFAVSEECAAYEECGVYGDVYGTAVLNIEYTDALPRPFDEVCADPETPASTVLRDRDLLTPEDAGHVYETC
ncbi:MAG: endo alpha-1,4 polygalactosaminidase [Actinomycetota bacterium]